MVVHPGKLAEDVPCMANSFKLLGQRFLKCIAVLHEIHVLNANSVLSVDVNSLLSLLDSSNRLFKQTHFQYKGCLIYFQVCIIYYRNSWT